MELSILSPERRAIKDTQSRCPVCLSTVPARVFAEQGKVYMEKACATHGEFRVLVANHEKWYYPSVGAARDDGATSGTSAQGGGACCGSGGCCAPSASVGAGASAFVGARAAVRASADPFESLSTCIALIEIVDSCNLTCPTCYAESPYGVGEQVDCVPFDEIVSRIEGVVARKGTVDVLQLSGGEPTIHPEFERVLRWAVTHPKIGYVLVNTNLVRVAGDERFRRMLGDVRAQHGKFELYAQFDGVQADGQRELRGADLRAMRERAIDLAGELGVPTTLAMVVDDRTLPGVGDTLRWAVGRLHVRGITFQPVFTSGRISRVESSTLPVFEAADGAGGAGGAGAAPNGASHAMSSASVTRATTTLGVGDVILACIDQAPELLSADDFTPLPCGDPNCHTIGYMLRTDDGPVGMSRLIDLPTLQGFLSDRVNYNLMDLVKCGCETEPLGELLKALEIGPEKPFRIFIKPFMDAWSFDQDRIDRCCTHVITPDGSLDSFCRYYLNGGRKGRA